MLHSLFQRWKLLLIAIIIFDVLILVLGAYIAMATDMFAAPPIPTVVAGPLPTLTPTPWAGPPGGTSTPLPQGPATPTPTTVLAESGFPPGFTPTPRPTQEPVYITFPSLFLGTNRGKDMPVINQVLYPEPFFAPGTNSACGPIALYAGLLGLGHEVDYGRIRDVAVSNGFNAAGMTTAGMVNTISTISHDLGNPFTLDHGRHFTTHDLLTNVRQGKVVLVLINVRKYNGRYYVTPAEPGSVGHFLLVENINTRKRTVRFAGSTLGMDEVPLRDFVASFTNNPNVIDPPEGWSSYLKQDGATGWALTLDPV